MKPQNHALLPWLILLLLAVGCGTSTNAAGASAADTSSDLGLAGTDATADVPADATTTVTPLVAQCQAAAQNFATKCAGEAVRVCLWGAYGQLCATGHTQLLIDAMKCLDATTCRTFSDANEGNACLDALHGADDTAVAKTFDQTQCTACGGGQCATHPGTAEIFPYLPDADLTSAGKCGGDACTPDATYKACLGAIATAAPFMACE